MTSEDLQPRTSSGSGFCRAGIVLALAVGAWLRFDGIADHDLWLDESCTFYYVHNMFDWPTDGPDPWLELTTLPYTFALHLWTRLTGETALGLRSFSAVMGCATILALAWAGLRMGGRRVALAAAALAAVCPLGIHYGQEARVYAMWCLELTLATFALYRASCTLATRWWVAYAALALLAVATQYYTLFWLPATVAGVVLAADRGRFVRRWLTTHLVMALIIAPLLILVVLRLTQRGSQGWLIETWREYPPALAIFKSLWVMLPSGWYPEYIGMLPRGAAAVADSAGALVYYITLWIPAVMTGVLLALWLTCCRPVAESQPDGEAKPAGLEECNRTIGFLVALVLLALLVPFMYSLVVRPAYIVGRYDLIAWPALMLAIPLLIATVCHRLLRTGGLRAAAMVVLTGLMVSCSVITVAGVKSIPPATDVSRRTASLIEAVGEDDLLVSLNIYRWHIAFELHRQGFTGDIISFPPAQDRQVGWANAESELSNPEALAAGVLEVVDKIERALDDGRRAWLLITGEPDDARLAVDSLLVGSLPDHGLSVKPAHEWLGLAEIIRSKAGAAAAEAQTEAEDESAAEAEAEAQTRDEDESAAEAEAVRGPKEQQKQRPKPSTPERSADREQMVRRQIEARGVRDRAVIEAMRQVPRHWFVPDRIKPYAYQDRPQAIGFNQTISQPYIVAFMTEALQLTPESKVLEVGTGSGYQAAVLSQITPHVYTIEIVEPLAKWAKQIFEHHGYDDIKAKVGDGYAGWPEHAPFDAIIVTCAPGHIPPKLFEQLEVGGRMCIPVGGVMSIQELLLVIKSPDGKPVVESLMPVRFVPMTGEARRRPD